MNQRIIFHIDVNSAYLSWEAVSRLQKGENLDLRDIPAVVGGDVDKRRGIVLAKSIPAKSEYRIKTGETLSEARNKCPDLTVVPPNYDLYLQCSNAMLDLLYQYSPLIERYSVDEMFLDYTNMEKHYGHFETAANTIKEHIKTELGFTVNIGVGPNKLLAKMASEFQKPDRVHHLFPHQLEEKMWPLPVEDLFMVGRATKNKLCNRGITTIGELAATPKEKLKLWLKSHGSLIWDFSHGREHSPVRERGVPIKGLGNSTTTPKDVTDKITARLWLLSLTEKVTIRLRAEGFHTQLVSVSIKDTDFYRQSCQTKLPFPTNSTQLVFKHAEKLLNQLWREEEKPLRHLGISVGHLTGDGSHQLSLNDYFYQDLDLTKVHLDRAMDEIRAKYGEDALIRSSFLHTDIPPMAGGVDAEESYPMMSSLL